MIRIVCNAGDSIPKLSPVYDRARLSDGTGMVGFTIHLADNRIKNCMEHYDAASRDAARARIELLHAQYSRKHVINRKGGVK